MKKSSDRSTAVEFLKTITELRRELSAANARIKELEIENAEFKRLDDQWCEQCAAITASITATDARATAAEASVVALVDLLKKEADRHAVEARVAAKAGRRLQGNHQHEIAGILLRLHEAALTATAAQSAAILRAEAVKLLGEPVAHVAKDRLTPTEHGIDYLFNDIQALPIGTPLFALPKE